MEKGENRVTVYCYCGEQWRRKGGTGAVGVGRDRREWTKWGPGTEGECRGVGRYAGGERNWGVRRKEGGRGVRRLGGGEVVVEGGGGDGTVYGAKGTAEEQVRRNIYKGGRESEGEMGKSISN
ncbi:hypothetical protein Tco_0201735 [Tanacetum coccineum]